MADKQTAAARPSAEQVVIAWQTSGSAAEAAARLEMGIEALYNRISHYRKAGVPLKLMPRPSRRPPKLDVPKLSRLAESLAMEAERHVEERKEAGDGEA